MTTLIFPATDVKGGEQKRSGYPTILADILRGSADAIDAILLFQSLLQDRESSPESLGFMAFDAHGGDTGCHLRAGMIQDLWMTFRQRYLDQSPDRAYSLHWFEEVLTKLEQLQDECRSRCKLLTYDRVLPEKIGFGPKRDTAAHIVSVMGWDEDNLKIQGCKTVTGYRAQPEPARSSGADRGWQNGHAKAESPFQSPDGVINTYGNLLNFLEGFHAPPQRNDEREYDWKLQSTWNLDDPSTVLRFLTYSFALSKYKVFFRAACHVGARLEPNAAEDYGNELIAPFWDRSNFEYKDTKIQRIVSQFRAMQRWLSDFSCAWVKSLTEKYSLQLALSNAVGMSIQTSATGLTAAACYPAFLVQYQHWADSRSPFIFIDRHFCPEGWHYNVFEANVSQNNGSFKWRLRLSSLGELTANVDNIRPCLAVMGNSIQGSYDRYMDRLPSTDNPYPHGSQVHYGTCGENEKHIQEFLLADHDRVTRGFFAAHDLYSFPLQSGENDAKFVRGCLSNPRVSHIREDWLLSRADADHVGSGKKSIHLFGWQHMFADTRSRLGERLTIWQQNNDLMPICAGTIY